MFWITDLLSTSAIALGIKIVISIICVLQLAWMAIVSQFHTPNAVPAVYPESTHKVVYYKHTIDNIIANRCVNSFRPDKIGTECTRMLSFGKRVRSAIYMDLVLRSGRKVSLDRINNSIMSIEALHAASLIVDDLPIFDNAKTRRGEPTIHTKHDTQLANLCAAALISTAMRYSSDLSITDKVLQDLCYGQYSENDTNVNMDTIMDYKTGALFQYAASLAMVDLKDEDNFELVNKAMGCLGRAYQIKDDSDDILTDTGRNYAALNPKWKETLELNIQMCNIYLIKSGYNSPLFDDIFAMLR